MSTIPDNQIPNFDDSLYRWVQNPMNKFVMDPSGEIHDYIMDWLRANYKQGEKTWILGGLEMVYQDIELQRYAEQASLSPYVVVTSLLNVHRKMMLWSDPDSWPEDGKDMSFWKEFGERMLWRPLWHKVLEMSRTQHSYLETLTETDDGGGADEAFCTLVKIICDEAKLTGSTAKLIKFSGHGGQVQVTVAERSDRVICYPWKQRWAGWLPSRDPLVMHRNTRRHITLPLWRRPESDSSSESGSESSSESD